MCDFRKRIKTFLDQLASDQILLCKPSDMIKTDLETSDKLGKIIFDHQWKVDKTDNKTFDGHVYQNLLQTTHKNHLDAFPWIKILKKWIKGEEISVYFPFCVQQICQNYFHAGSMRDFWALG